MLTTADPRLPAAPIASPVDVPLPAIAADAWLSRGQIVHQEPYDPPLDDATSVLGASWRAVYRSVSGLDGRERDVTGAFFLPTGEPPVDGWPVISFAHGTTGIGTDCGPARQPDMHGYAPIVETLLERKYAVALTDYEGLGPTGSHPYLEQRTAAFNTIDAVRALRGLSPEVSNRWAAIGYSQGGQAVWAANELNDDYGDGLDLVGTVALAPAANVTATADLMASGSLTEEQLSLLPLFVVGLSRYNPDLDERAFLGRATRSQVKRLSHCAPRTPVAPSRPPTPVPWKTVVDLLSESNETTPEASQDIDELRDAMRKIALPKQPLHRPMLVVSGALDSLVFSQWVSAAAADSCALGGTIEYRQMSGVDHANILWRSAAIVGRWVADRFDGIPAPSNCADESPR